MELLIVARIPPLESDLVTRLRDMFDDAPGLPRFQRLWLFAGPAPELVLVHPPL